jgi:hypothetical protein
VNRRAYKGCVGRLESVRADPRLSRVSEAFGDPLRSMPGIQSKWRMRACKWRKQRNSEAVHERERETCKMHGRMEETNKWSRGGVGNGPVSASLSRGVGRSCSWGGECEYGVSADSGRRDDERNVPVPLLNT